MATIRIRVRSGKRSGAAQHRCSAYLNRRIERDHRGVKQRYYPMLRFGALVSAQRFCRAFEEVRQYFQPRRKQNQVISLPDAADSFCSEHSHWNRCSSQRNPATPSSFRLKAGFFHMVTRVLPTFTIRSALFRAMLVACQDVRFY
jgi:hypothetical protein